MRLLKRLTDNAIELVSFDDNDVPSYAILSHTWTDGQEVTYNELVAGTGKDKTGYDKISFCVERAAKDDLQYCWIDTCCIDKSTSDELQTAINSMFRWYQRASKCYVYLSDVQVGDEVKDVQAFPITWIDAFQRSRWFKRGWTLQELLAPATVDFFSKEGKCLGNKLSLAYEIHKITAIPVGALRGQSVADFSVEERMSWAIERTTTLKEDKVYCLLGIFDVFLPLIYGEGEAYATSRLEEEIQRWQAKGEEIWLDLLTDRKMGDRCRNCGSVEHWERQCWPRKCGKCESFEKITILNKPNTLIVGLRTGHTASYCRHLVRCYMCKS